MLFIYYLSLNFNVNRLEAGLINYTACIRLPGAGGRLRGGKGLPTKSM